MKLRELLKLLLKPIFFIVKDPGGKGMMLTIYDVTPTFRHAKKIALNHKDAYVLVGFKVSQ